MGHHLFIFNQKSLPMRDSDVALVRHFLIESARRLGDESLTNAVIGWDYQGPGVWVGIDPAVLAGHDSVFTAGIGLVEKFGDEVTVDYLSSKVVMAGTRWLKGCPTSDIVAHIRQLQEHLHDRT